MLSGTRLLADVALPITVSGNGISVIGNATTVSPEVVVPGPNTGDPGDPGTPGDLGTDNPGDEPGTTPVGAMPTANAQLALTGAGGIELLALLAALLGAAGAIIRARARARASAH